MCISDSPWGFDVNILDEITQIQSMSSSAFRARIRKPAARIPLKDGDVAVVVGHINMRHPHIDPFYVVLVNGRKTGIFSMFLKSVDRS